MRTSFVDMLALGNPTLSLFSHVKLQEDIVGVKGNKGVSTAKKQRFSEQVLTKMRPSSKSH